MNIWVKEKGEISLWRNEFDGKENIIAWVRGRENYCRWFCKRNKL